MHLQLKRNAFITSKRALKIFKALASKHKNNIYIN